MTIQTDIAILGGGPGGYVAALRAAQLGARVALIEEKAVGGVCLNVGCIPTKALLRSAEVYRTFRQAEAFGLRLEGAVMPDWPAIQAHKETIVQLILQASLGWGNGRTARRFVFRGCGTQITLRRSMILTF